MAPSSLAATPLKIVFAGHVDHGKSTLIGCLVYETVIPVSARRGDNVVRSTRKVSIAGPAMARSPILLVFHRLMSHHWRRN